MVEDDQLDALFFALSDRTRRGMLARLVDGPLSVGELAAPLPMSLAAASKHLKVLERAGLISRAVDGRVHRMSIHAPGLRDAHAWLDVHRAFWESQLDRLDRYLATLDDPRAASTDRPNPSLPSHPEEPDA